MHAVVPQERGHEHFHRQHGVLGSCKSNTFFSFYFILFICTRTECFKERRDRLVKEMYVERKR